MGCTKLNKGGVFSSYLFFKPKKISAFFIFFVDFTLTSCDNINMKTKNFTYRINQDMYKKIKILKKLKNNSLQRIITDLLNKEIKNEEQQNS